MVKNSLASAEDLRDVGWIPGSGRSPEEGCGNPLQYFLPGRSHGQRSLVGTVHRVTKSQTQLKRLSRHACVNKPSTVEDDRKGPLSK